MKDLSWWNSEGLDVAGWNSKDLDKGKPEGRDLGGHNSWVGGAPKGMQYLGETLRWVGEAGYGLVEVFGCGWVELLSFWTWLGGTPNVWI